jgi:DNA invertase Pin-like site-specific DNA recombinase
MTTLVYLRVSKDPQDTKNQRLAIWEFARAERMDVDEFLDSIGFCIFPIPRVPVTQG